jgi:phosphoglycolate phosphatase
MDAIKVVAFDCDGVLFDSSEANRAYYDHILEKMNLPPMAAEQLAYAHMHTVFETLAFLIKDPRQLEAAHAYRRNLSYLPFIGYMKVEPTLAGLLGKLRPAFKTAIATNRTDTMARVLEEHHLKGAFDRVVTALDVRHPKPDPEQLFLLMTHFNIQPSEMIYIGDSELDAAAAHQAGVSFLAYGNKELPAVRHIDSLSQVAEFLGL